MRQHSQAKRRLIIGAFGLAVAPLVLASVAYACTSLTSLNVNPSSGAAGVSVALTGSNYRTAADSGPVEIRLNSRTGPVIASLPVSSINPDGRTISMNATIPANAALGYQTLIATQVNTTTGALLSGFPVRAAYKVTSVASGKEAAAVAAPDAAAEPAATDAAASEPGRTGSDTAPAAPSAAPVGASATEAVRRATPPAAAAAVTAVVAPSSPPVGTTAAGPGTPAPPAADLGGAAPTGSVTPAAAAAIDTRSGGLIPAAAGGTASLLPDLTLALGLAIVLLSLAAFLKSGRTMLAGRRLPSPA